MKMKKIALLVLSVFLMIPAAVNAEPAQQKIAVVNVQRIVSSSAQVKALQSSQEAKVKEIAKFIKNAQADINKQKDEKAKQDAAKKYEKQLAAKREANAKEYKEKLQALDKSINDQIAKKAAEMGYTMIISKTAVVFGGDDITEDIVKVIK